MTPKRMAKASIRRRAPEIFTPRPTKSSSRSPATTPVKHSRWWKKTVSQGFSLARITTSRRTRHSRSEEHTSELQSLTNLVCRLLLEKKKKNTIIKVDTVDNRTLQLLYHR